MNYGIFGGAFDPFHVEHASLIEQARKKLALDTVILVPSFNPPHKEKDQVSFSHRVRMLEAYARDKPYIFVDKTEEDLALNDSYTYKILPQIKKSYASFGTPYFLMGADSLLAFPRWARPELIAKEAVLGVATRAGYPITTAFLSKLKKEYGAAVAVFGGCKAVSSTEVRTRLALNYKPELCLDNSILSYIRQYNLYAYESKMVSRVSVAMDTKKYEHVQEVVLFAVQYARQLKLPYKQVFTAALLHDIAKNRAPMQAHYPTTVPSVIHQYDGRLVAEKEFGVTDPAVLDAIEYHATGKPNMSMLGRLIYAADKLEATRDYGGVAALRKALAANFDNGFRLLLKNQMEHLKLKGKEPDGLTQETYNYYNE